MADVFISYSRSDKEFGRQLMERLQAKMFDFWIDWASIPASSDWVAEILYGIENTHTFVSLLSSSWSESPICQLELAYAILFRKRIIPVFIEDFEKPYPNPKLGPLAMSMAAEANEDLETVRQNYFPTQTIVEILERNWDFVSGLDYLQYDSDYDLEEFVEKIGQAVQVGLDAGRKHTSYHNLAKQWDIRGRKQEDLLRGKELETAMQWLEENAMSHPTPTDLHRQFILEAYQLHQKQQGTLTSRLRTSIFRILPLGPRKVFLSYRRDDSADACGRIYDRLKPVFGGRNLFLDVDTIEFGTDFSQYIQHTLTECFAVLAVIGPDWLDMLHERANRDEPDFVKIELEIALKRHHVNVIPLLVSGASMPDPNKLPSSLRGLTMMNGTQVRAGRDFHRDMDVLIKELKQLRSKARIKE